MNILETLINSFIADYYSWNQWAFEQSEKLGQSEKKELAEIGVDTSVRPDQIKNIARYIEIKTKYSAEIAKLLPLVGTEYKKIIDKYCRPDHQYSNSSWGSESSHDPQRETIVSIENKDGKAIVKTQLIYENSTFTNDFEYILTYEDQRWYLEQIYYVNEEGRYEGL